MGLTGFNRQRKRTLSSELDIDEQLADKILAFGYSTPKAVKDADSLPFLSDEELKQLKRKPKSKPTKQEAKAEKEPEGTNEEDPEPEQKPEPAEISDVDEEFLALPDDTVFPHNYGGSWFYLSNGKQVNGKANAQKAQAELDGG